MQQIDLGCKEKTIPIIEHPRARLQRINQAVETRFGDFLATRVTAQAAERDEAAHPVPREILAEAGQLGLLGYSLPIDAGGEGRDAADWGLALEHIGYLCDDLSFSLVTSLYSAVCGAIYRSGRQDLIETYVRPIIRGERLASFAYTENADAFAFQSTARRIGNRYILNGHKVLVTGGAMADTFMTYLRDEQDDLKVFLVERDDPGVVVRPAPTMGFRAAGLSSLEFQDTIVDANRVLVEADGLSHAQDFLNRRRVILICASLGRMRGLLTECAHYLRNTTRYGQPLTEMQSVQAKLGRMVVWAETAQMVVHTALDHLASGDADRFWDPRISTTKYYVVDRAIELAREAIGLVGGHSYTKNLPFERNLRDFVGLIPGAGSQNTLETDLGIHFINTIEYHSKN